MTSRDSTQADPVVALSTDFALAARTLFSAGTPTETMAHVLRLAVATIEGCDFAGVLLETDGAPGPLHTDPVAAGLDALQRRCGQGPGVDAIAEGVIAYAEDLSTDDRWPLFRAQAGSTGVRSILALPLTAELTLGTLTLSARYPQAFGVIDRARGVLLAALAAVALTSAQSHEQEERREANLHAALATREVIGQAQGILIERERVTADQAFDILRRASQHLNQKLRAVAQNLVDTGEPPGNEGPGAPTG